MANKTKLTPELLNELKEMASAGMNALAISKKLGNPRQTIQNWADKNNIILQKRTSIKSQQKRLKFISIIEEALASNVTIKLNKILRHIELHPDTAQKILNEKIEYRMVIRTKKEGILQDKTLPLPIAQNRLPDQNDKVTGFTEGKYKITTEDGHVYRKTSAKIEQGDPRGKCGKPLTEKQVITRLKKIGYTYIDGFEGNIKETMRVKHDECGVIRSNRLEGLIRQGCPSCTNTGTSKGELEVLALVHSFGLEAYSTRKIIKPKELDIYIPSLKLAIEYCGLYWHSEISGKSKNYHYDKMKACEAQGIRLITLFSDEWEDRKEQVTGFLTSVLGQAKQRVFARKCVVKEVEGDVAKDFLDTYHIQGKALFKIAFGIYFEDELLGLVSGSGHHRQKGSDAPFVLNRLVFKKDTCVVGGTSKLLKHLINYARNEGYPKLISWSDSKFSQGAVYEKTGFTMVQELRSDYSYVVGATGKRQSKQSNKKKCLLSKGAIGSMVNTENELAKTLNLNRIWDCGKKRFSIDLS